MDGQKLYKRYSLFFWLNNIFIILVFIAVFLLEGGDVGNNASSNVTLERWSIIITLASIPFALRMFHSYLKKSNILEHSQYLSRYKKLYIGRLLLLDLVAGINIIGFEIYKANNFIYLTIVVIFALLFCHPNRDDLAKRDTATKENNTNSNDSEI